MNALRKVLHGSLAQVLTGSILLVSDLQNRTSPRVKNSGPIPADRILFAVKGLQYTIGLTYFGPDPTFDMTMRGLFSPR